MAGWSEKIQQ